MLWLAEQDPACTRVFRGSSLALETFFLLMFKMPFELVILVPDLYRIGTQPYSVPFLVTSLNYVLPGSTL